VTDVRFPTPAGELTGYLAEPETAGPSPGVVVLHEAFGLTDDTRAWADRFAGEGYVALAPDIYHRSGKLRTAGYDELPKALELMGALTDDGIVADVSSAIGWAEKQPNVKAGRIGITGFCMGGRVSYLAACALPEKITASAPFYGGGIPVDRTASLKAPVLAFFGEKDAFIPLEFVEQLRREAAAQKKLVEIVVYPGADHGFFCNERASYNAKAAADAWQRLKTFFATHLGR